METSSDQLFQCPPVPTMMMDRRWRANVDPAPNCPRCASSNTKFCYYNNYSLSQPRFFCKGCRRYWTRGGSLRSVPVGGGCRKSRRSRSVKSSLSSSSVVNTSPIMSSDCSQESGCPDIDMAAVFAKYLNHDHGNLGQEINEATNTTPTTSSEASHDSLTSSSCGMENVFESHMFADDFLDPESQVMKSLNPDHNHQVQEEEAVPGFINPDLASFDDIIEDVFWSEDSNMSDLTWQPITQSREFDSALLPVDQYDVSTDLVSTDNWSYFDNSGFEVFSRT
ncbi:hypothetical protein RND81_02G082800 [Saponaria officinalis]|uniref:Dof zinc finger protein n=1 Tax=Saponaria officinalis TaxID=3572 RepID=A0AAW1MLG0_SAPOF